MVFIESLQIFADGVLVVETLRYEDSHCLGQREPAHHQKLEDIVQTGGIAHAFLDDGTQILDVAQRLAVENAFTRLHPTAIAADGVDLAIVGQQTKRLGQ